MTKPNFSNSSLSAPLGGTRPPLPPLCKGGRGLRGVRGTTTCCVETNSGSAPSRLAILFSGLFLSSLLCGCGPAQSATVTMKSAEARAGDAAAGGGAAESAATPAATAAAGFGNLAGSVLLEGEAPQPGLLVKQGDAGAKDAAVCAAANIEDEGLVVNAANSGIANVVLYLAKRPSTVKPELAQPPKEAAVFDQKGCRFLPHVTVVQVGQPLLVLSDDTVLHNTHTYPVRNNSFNQGIPPKNREGVPINYGKAENQPVEVKCDLHPWMRAWHFPIDHPYVAVTDKDGKFRIEGLPSGKHTLKVWQEKAPGGLLERKLDVTIEADKDTSLELKYDSKKFGG